jgi:predicted enzyme related to lactoylglutathione lyase
MDYDTVSAQDFGASLRGIGMNLLVKDTEATARFLENVLGMTIHRLTKDFAIVTYNTDIFQLHQDGTYGAHPMLGLLPESPPRGGGVAIYVYENDPDTAVAQAEHYGATVIQGATDKPHGLREAMILCPDGYAWFPAVSISS